MYKYKTYFTGEMTILVAQTTCVRKYPHTNSGLSNYNAVNTPVRASPKPRLIQGVCRAYAVSYNENSVHIMFTYHCVKSFAGLPYFVFLVWIKKKYFTIRGPCIVIYSYNWSQQDELFINFILINNTTCFGQTYCPSSGVLILYSIPTSLAGNQQN